MYTLHLQISDALFSLMLGGSAAAREIMVQVSACKLEMVRMANTTISSSSTLDPYNSTIEPLLNLAVSDEADSTGAGDCSGEDYYVSFATASYASLQYSFFSNSGVEVMGGVLFLLTAVWIVRDKLACETAVSGERWHAGDSPNISQWFGETSSLEV